ncbi:MAG: alpha/beta hydrolase [Hyphomicrobiaceae bacterium]
MTDAQPQFLTVGEGQAARKIAYITSPGQIVDGKQPTGLMWLLGLKSDMVSTKASALAEWAGKQGYAMTRFEYSAHGQSEGNFSDATIGDWLEESEAVFQKLTAGSQVLVGSSTGGYLALLLVRRLLEVEPAAAKRIKALVLIAPAWDLTEDLMWQKFSEETRREIMEQGVHLRPSDYGEPYMITRKFIEEGRKHLFAGKPFDPGCPVVILQGALDPDVPLEHAQKLAKFTKGAEIIVVPDAEHRMSRSQDLALLFETIDNVIAR